MKNNKYQRLNPFTLSSNGKLIEVVRCAKQIAQWMKKGNTAGEAFNKASQSYSFHIALAASESIIRTIK